MNVSSKDQVLNKAGCVKFGARAPVKGVKISALQISKSLRSHKKVKENCVFWQLCSEQWQKTCYFEAYNSKSLVSRLLTYKVRQNSFFFFTTKSSRFNDKINFFAPSLSLTHTHTHTYTGLCDLIKCHSRSELILIIIFLRLQLIALMYTASYSLVWVIVWSRTRKCTSHITNSHRTRNPRKQCETFCFCEMKIFTPFGDFVAH